MNSGEQNYIELHILRKSCEMKRKSFLHNLYLFFIKNRNCKYIKLYFSENIFDNIDKFIFDKIFISYIFELEETFFGYGKVLREIVLKATLNVRTHEEIKIVQELGWDKMQIFKDFQLEDSIVIGAYDYQTYIVISNIDAFDVLEIKTLLLNTYDINTIKKMTNSKMII